MSAPERVYAVVDPAVEPRLYPLLKAIGELDAPCLFAGKIDEQLREVSPHIFAVENGREIVQRWIQQGGHQPWGLFMTSTLGLAEVRRHIRRFLQVRLPDGRGPVLFRIWDPRVLPPFLLASEADHVSQLFARVSSYLIARGPALERLVAANGVVQSQPADWRQVLAA